MTHVSLSEVLFEVVRGKAISRTLTNVFWKGRAVCSGRILDVGGGGHASHYRFLDVDKNASIKVVDVIPRVGTDFVLDITSERVPLPDGSQDFIFMFNILEHIFEHKEVLTEAHRLLAPRGTLLGTIPFLINVHPDPHDYVRFTKEALSRIFEESGFSVEIIEPIGRGPFLAGYEQLDMLIWNPLHLLFLPIVWCLDGLLAFLRPKRDFRAQFPLAYNFIVKRIV
ncbi:MAG: hypothetical protein A2849_01075 [Candidatus Taylorbacteria bacterium RIFCSPHIGHO2_01_FULL_51_15]|uniref:Methyltransferase type 11 domain-containing protein n=1 Tax=Candidatus Taylorbacteria bacterium RIFCSPHIGHO2_01_FULL_51_15 TaxID=1802304 RepID=A0A1G2MBF1_9BACT|nr:MAG: hypothetical protein A2849_01075 [Candidatus Taylorbacteria bacterium RIFCSPHIGHO2_01_FULL_51_15]